MLPISLSPNSPSLPRLAAHLPFLFTPYIIRHLPITLLLPFAFPELSHSPLFSASLSPPRFNFFILIFTSTNYCGKYCLPQNQEFLCLEFWVIFKPFLVKFSSFLTIFCLFFSLFTHPTPLASFFPPKERHTIFSSLNLLAF